MKLIFVLLLACICINLLGSTFAAAGPIRGGAKIDTAPVENIVEEESDDDEIIARSPSQEEGPPPALPERLLKFALSHPLEDVGFVLVLLCVLMYFRGKRYNRKLVQAWMDQQLGLFSEHFASVPPSWVMTEESYNTFRVAASGRINCEGAVMTFQLQKRQDLLSFVYGFITGARDTVTMEVLMNPEVMDPFVLGVASKTEWKRLKTEHNDLKDNASPQTSPQSLPANLVVASDSAEVVKALLHDEVCKVLGGARRLFISMHFTDSNGLSKHKQVLRFVFALPDPKDMSQLDALTRMSLVFIDKVAAFKLSEKAKAKAEKIRRLVLEQQLKETEKDRQEAAQQRKLERQRKERQEKEEKIKKLTGAEKQRAMEKLEAERQKELMRSREKMQRSKVVRIGS